MRIPRQKNFGLLSAAGNLVGSATGIVGATSMIGGAGLVGLGSKIIAHPIIPGAALLGYGLHKLIQHRKRKRAERRAMEDAYYNRG